jgi:hypothetical protein
MGNLKICIGVHFPCILLLCAASKIIIWRPIFTKWFFLLYCLFLAKHWNEALLKSKKIMFWLFKCNLLLNGLKWWKVHIDLFCREFYALAFDTPMSLIPWYGDFLRKMQKSIRKWFFGFSNVICSWMAQNGEKSFVYIFHREFYALWYMSKWLIHLHYSSFIW